MEEKPQKPRKKQFIDSSFRDSHYFKYSAMGFQMAAIIGIGVFCGIKIDEFIGLQKAPIFTIAFSLLSVIAAIYFVVKDLLKK